jgi:hypothetical protein
MQTRSTRIAVALIATLAVGLALALPAQASSHREAPFITEMPKVDGTDFYMFRSYEPGRDGYVILIANYIPLQDPYGGPNYFTLDQDAEYVIHVDNDGDGVENLSFVFDFNTFLKGVALPVGGAQVPIPLIQAGTITTFDNVNRFENYSLTLVRGRMNDQPATRQPRTTPAINQALGANAFAKAIDNVGAKSFPQGYENYAQAFMHDLVIDGCGDGRVFVGQRKDPFVVNLGETFDLINYNPLGPRDAESDDLADKNVTSLVLELPIACLTEAKGEVIGGWTTARLPRNRRLVANPTFEQPAESSGPMMQVSRLGMPLVNEVVIGLPDKNLFNTVRPEVDAALATYVTNPTLPELIQILFPVQAPNNFPRMDLVAAFATGIAGVNQLTDGQPHEMLRLNTSIPVTPAAAQSSLGALGGDLAGFPNGRRVGDDVVDIELRVAMGVLCHAFPGAFGCGPADAPSGDLPYTDGALVDALMFPSEFPFLNTPIPGSPSSAGPN